MSDGERQRQRAAEGLVDAIVELGVDSAYFIDALTQTLRSLRPVNPESSLTGAERQLLITMGTFTEDELERIESDVLRGSLQLADVESWMLRLLDTFSIEGAAAYLKLTAEELLGAVNRQEILAVTIAGHLRFPRWQFVLNGKDRLLPGLPALISALPDSEPLAWAAFMHRPQQDLSGFGPRSPVQWLLEGGDIDAVVELLEEDPW